MTTLKRWTGTVWEPVGLPNGGNPVGLLGSAIKTTNQSTITSEVAVAGLSVNVTVAAGRTLRIRFQGGLSRTVADGVTRVLLKQNGTTIQFKDYFVRGASEGHIGIDLETLVSPSAGAHTFSVSAQQVTGSGSSGIVGDGTGNQSLTVEDITPTPQPANTAPSATLGYSEYVGGTQTLGAASDTPVADTSVTITVPAGRRLKLTALIHLRSSVASDTVYARIREQGVGGNAQFTYTNELSASPGTSTITSIITPSAGTHTYYVAATRGSGSGSVSVYGAGGEPSFLLVEDITGTTSDSAALTTVQDAVADSGWTLMTLQNGFTNYGGGFADASYRKIGKTVHLRGLVSCVGTTGATIATLPVGYRPTNGNLLVACSTGEASAYARLDITTAGALATVNRGANWFSIAGVSFLAD